MSYAVSNLCLILTVEKSSSNQS